jgi:hypothetical protein
MVIFFAVRSQISHELSGLSDSRLMPIMCTNLLCKFPLVKVLIPFLLEPKTLDPTQHPIPGLSGNHLEIVI